MPDAFFVHTWSKTYEMIKECESIIKIWVSCGIVIAKITDISWLVVLGCQEQILAWSFQITGMKLLQEL